jgi:hypothetical protein
LFLKIQSIVLAFWLADQASFHFVFQNNHFGQ